MILTKKVNFDVFSGFYSNGIFISVVSFFANLLSLSEKLLIARIASALAIMKSEIMWAIYYFLANLLVWLLFNPFDAEVA